MADEETEQPPEQTPGPEGPVVPPEPSGEEAGKGFEGTPEGDMAHSQLAQEYPVQGLADESKTPVERAFGDGAPDPEE